VTDDVAGSSRNALCQRIVHATVGFNEHSLLQSVIYGGKVLSRYLGYRQESRRFIHWREVPAAPRTIGHFHSGLLPRR